MVKRVFADMAQLVEHLVPIQEVAGSSPVVRSLRWRNGIRAALRWQWAVRSMQVRLLS